MNHRLASLGAAIVAALASLPVTARGQEPWDFRAPGLTRQQLEQALARFDAAALSPAYSDALRARARADADSARIRLRDGDLRVGDRILLSVEGPQVLPPNTLVVSTGPQLVMPQLGTVPLAGVLRSEAEALVSRAVDRVYRGAVVHVRLLTRVAVIGGVARPGFYPLSDEALIADAITAAGGPAPDAQLLDVYVERGRDRLWQPDSLQAAMRDGRTIAQLGLQDGDRIVIPRPGARNWEAIFRTLGYAISIPLSLFALTQIKL